MVEQVIPDAGKLVKLAERCEAMLEMDDPTIMAFWRECFPMPLRIRQPGFEHVSDGIGPYTPEFSAWNAARATVQKFSVNGAWLDAAMTLVPEEWLVEIMSQIAGDGMCFVRLANPFLSREATGIGKELEHALCAAALRARAQPSSDAAKSEGEV